MSFQLTIRVDAFGLQSLQASGQSIAIVRTREPPATGGTLLAWQIVSPRLVSQLSWEETYYLYASQTLLAPGATVVPCAQSPAPSTLGTLSTFANGAITGGAKGGGNPDAYTLLNNTPGPPHSCGLAQPALVNDATSAAPLTATPLAYHMQLAVMPPPALYVFLTSFRGNGTMVVYAGNPVLTLPTARGAQPPVTIAYNDATQGFYVVPG